MNHIFISHAGADSAWAERLDKDLRNVGHDVRVDMHRLHLGDNSIAFMNESLKYAHTVIILHSKDTVSAKWQTREIDAATWQEIQHGRVRLIVLKLDDTEVPPLLAPKVYGSLNEDTYRELLERLCSEIIPSETPNKLVSFAFQEGSPNPFWRLRAEYFDEIPRQLADSFSPPAAEKIGTLEEMRPCFLEGSRGTGKTMLLMSLRARTLVVRKDTKKNLKDLFGFYVRLTRGAFCNAGLLATPNGRLQDIEPKTLVQITDTFTQEFFITLIESLLSEVAYCIREGHLSCEGPMDAALASEIYKIVTGGASGAPSSIEGLLDYCMQMHRKIAEFTKRRFIYQEEAFVPIATLDLDAFKQILKTTKKIIRGLEGTQMVVLLDEYENLLEHQKVVVNDLVKLGPPDLSVKIAKKIGTADSSETMSGQELQEIHDYNRIPLVYAVDDDREFDNYCQLLGSILSKALAANGSTPGKPEEVLPEFSSEECSQQELRDEVRKMSGAEAFDKLASEQQAGRAAYYRHAAIYRLVYGKPGGGREKQYAGFKELAFLSSGIIRYFQEIVGMGYYLQYGSGTAKGRMIRIEPTNQQRAVYVISEHNLAALSRNVEKYGERLKYFLLDLGDCLRFKLLHHSTEPEAGRLSLNDPEKLVGHEFAELQEFLTLGVREGVFQLPLGRPGMRPKHSADPQPVEFNISRVFCPALQFSPRFRWKTSTTCKELADLLASEKRAATKKRFVDRLIKKQDDPRQGNLGLQGHS